MMTLGGFVFGGPARDLSPWHEQRTGQSVKDWIAEQESVLQSNKQ